MKNASLLFIAAMGAAQAYNRTIEADHGPIKVLREPEERAFNRLGLRMLPEEPIFDARSHIVDITAQAFAEVVKLHLTDKKPSKILAGKSAFKFLSGLTPDPLQFGHPRFDGIHIERWDMLPDNVADIYDHNGGIIKRIRI